MLQEAVGEPRFGLDVDAPIEPSPEKWDNLAWVERRSRPVARRSTCRSRSSVDAGRHRCSRASSGVANAADMAYILYQEPVMVAVHGRNMLKNLAPPA